MERNMEFARELLRAMNEHPRSIAIILTRDEHKNRNEFFDLDDDDLGGYFLDAPEGHTEEELHYHLDLMEEAGLIASANGPPYGLGTLYKLSWDGHEFLAETQQEGVWERIKSQFGDELPGIAWSVVRQAVTKAALELTRGAS